MNPTITSVVVEYKVTCTCGHEATFNNGAQAAIAQDGHKKYHARDYVMCRETIWVDGLLLKCDVRGTHSDHHATRTEELAYDVFWKDAAK